jgi:hypothetical protein
MTRDLMKRLATLEQRTRASTKLGIAFCASKAKPRPKLSQPTKTRTAQSGLTVGAFCVSSSTSLSRRLRKLEAMQPDKPLAPAFLWPQGQSLDDALAAAGLTLNKPVFAIELMGVKDRDVKPLCPLHERDRHKLLAAS